MKQFKGLRLWTMALASLALLLGLSAVVVQHASSNAAPRPRVVILGSTSPIVSPKPTLFERWVPRSRAWGWLWQTRQFLLGRRRTVTVDATVLELSGSPDAWLGKLLRAEDAPAETNGMRVWLLDGDRIPALRRELGQNAEVLRRSSVITVDGGMARVLNGTSIPTRGAPLEAGFKMDLLPGVHGETIDLQATVSLSELVTAAAAELGSADPTAALAVQTNFAVNARLQLTNGGCAFLVETKSGSGKEKRVGVLLTAKLGKGVSQ